MNLLSSAAGKATIPMWIPNARRLRNSARHERPGADIDLAAIHDDSPQCVGAVCGKSIDPQAVEQAWQDAHDYFESIGVFVGYRMKNRRLSFQQVVGTTKVDVAKAGEGNTFNIRAMLVATAVR